MTGWQSYGAWAYDLQGADGIFLVDDEVRFRTSSMAGAPGMSAPRAAIRLVGLSGVGKTRFAQALFDATLGSDALSPSAALTQISAVNRRRRRRR